MKVLLLQVTYISVATAEFQWFLSRKYNDCEEVPEDTFTGTPIARKEAKHFVCWRDMDKNPEWTGETFKLGDCGENCCDLVSPSSTYIQRRWRGSAWISRGCEQATKREDFISGPFYSIGVEGEEKKVGILLLVCLIIIILMSQVCISTKPTDEDDKLSAFPVTMNIKTCMDECCVFGY